MKNQLDDYRTPEELLNMYPYTNEIGWTVSNLEFLAQEELVLSDESTGVLKIEIASFERILDFHKKKKEDKN